MIRLVVFFMLACFSLTASAETRYFNADGDPVSREEYEKLKEEWYEYLAENKEKPKARVRYVKPGREPAVPETDSGAAVKSGDESEIPAWIRSESSGGGDYGYDDSPVERGTYAPSGGGGGQPKRDKKFENKLRLMR